MKIKIVEGTSVRFTMCDVTSFRSQSFSDSSFLGENVPDLKVNTITTVHSPNTLLRYLCFNLLFQLIQLESDPNDVSVASDLLFSCENLATVVLLTYLFVLPYIGRILIFNLYNCFYFNRHVQWQCASANCGSSMISYRFAKYLHYKIGATIHYFVLFFEVVR